MSGEKILIVEDEVILAMSMKQELISLGYNVMNTVETGKKAVISANELKPDLILMDITLKGEIDGIEAAKKINETLDIPIIYMTAYSDEDILNRAIMTEPYAYILKPFNKEEVNANIKTVIYKHNSEKKKRSKS